MSTLITQITKTHQKREQFMSISKECSRLAKEKSKIGLIQSIFVVGVPLVVVIEILLVFNMISP